MRLQLFSAADVKAALPMRDCVEVMKRAFADFTSGRAQVPQRLVMPLGEGNALLAKPAAPEAWRSSWSPSSRATRGAAAR